VAQDGASWFMTLALYTFYALRDFFSWFY